MTPDPMSLPSLAIGLLREKGHIIYGGNAVWSIGGNTFVIDGVTRTQGEVVRLASRYPEWRDKERQHLEALRSHQRSLALTSD